MNRVVITGMGAITPLGNDVASFWDGLKNGKNGIDFHYKNLIRKILMFM